jgi:hypothetical protein
MGKIHTILFCDIWYLTKIGALCFKSIYIQKQFKEKLKYLIWTSYPGLFSAMTNRTKPKILVFTRNSKFNRNLSNSSQVDRQRDVNSSLLVFLTFLYVKIEYGTHLGCTKPNNALFPKIMFVRAHTKKTVCNLERLQLWHITWYSL